MSSVVDMLASGGPIVWILIVLSFVSLAVIIAKALQLRGVISGGTRRERAFDLWAAGDRAAAMREVETGGSPIDRLLDKAMRGLATGLPRPALDEDLEWRGNVEMASMNRSIRLLELIAVISPLLGLLGTVLGMIQAFRELALAQGAANASLLAAGIWQALLTTAAGLIVAIPAAIAASLLSARVDSAGQQIEAAIGRLFALDALAPGNRSDT